jgi:lipopolysaccharide transport system ATP-binding protein
MADIAIRVTNLGKAFKLYARKLDKVLDIFGLARRPFWNLRAEEFWVLRGLNLTIGRGERVGIIGSNGAGKSTLLKAISGNLTPTTGTVEVHGTIQSLMVLGVGFHPEFTGRENIRAALGLQGMSREQIAQREREIEDFSELGPYIDQPVRTYSAGMYARLAFSTATAVTPDILIVDEVLGAGDAYFAGKSMERMRGLTEGTGATAILVSHDLSAIQTFSDRVVWIDRGQVRADGDPLEVCKAYYKQVQDRENRRRAIRVSDDPHDQAHAARRRFRLRPANAAAPIRVRSARLTAGDELYSEVHVGGPMDNDSRYPDHIVAGHGSPWGPAADDESGWYRELQADADFVLGWPGDEVSRPWRLEVNVDIPTGAALDVEMEEHGEFRRVGSASEAIVLAEGNGSDAGLREPRRSVITDHLPATRIVGLRFLNDAGRAVTGVEEGEPLTAEIAYWSDRPVDRPEFAMTFFTTDGRRICHANTALAGVRVERIAGAGTVRFRFDPFPVGPGEYVVSCSIFQYLDVTSTAQPPYYDQHDRAYRFKVWKALGVAYDLGLVRVGYTVHHVPAAEAPAA